MDLSRLSYKELQELEKEVQRQKELRNDLRVYEVKFYIGILAKRAERDWRLEDADGFGEYFVNEPMRFLEKDLGLTRGVEDISGFDVKELGREEFPEMFKI